ncbi:MAG: hypothetical protein L0Z53_02840 [Acidobacteriales bacterium]|nr:hypothetical protein [Terriglobales bacterium]
MKERATQVLLAIVSVLLAAQLFRSAPLAVKAEDTAAAPAIVRAQVIELVDDQGQTRAQLKVEPDGEAVLRMRDAKGTIRVKLGASESGSGLLLLDGSTEPAVHLLAAPSGTSVTLAQRGREKRVIKP